MKLYTIFIAVCLLFSACDKKEPVIENAPGVMRINDTGACRVLIVLNNGKSLFPTNVDKLQSFLTNGRQVTVSYRPDKDFVSPCSGSEPVLIESIR